MRNLAVFLNKQGVSSEIITLCDREKWKPSTILQSKSVDQLRVLVWPCYRLSPIANALSMPLKTHCLVSNPSLLRKHLESFDVLHFHDDVDLSFPLACLGLKKPRVFSFHSLPYHLSYYSRNPIALKLLVRSTSLFHVFSRKDRQALGRLVPNERIRIVPHGVDVNLFLPAREQGRRSQVNIVWVGRIERQKGLITLLQAFHAITQNSPTPAPVELLIAGKVWDNQCYIELLEYKNRMQLTGVRFLGFVENLPAFLQKADIFVCPSLQETFGIVNLEAMACGLSVVATSVGGITDVLVDEETGFLVPPDDPRTLAEKLSILINDSKLRKNMGKKARTRAEYFSMERTAEMMTKVYSELPL